VADSRPTDERTRDTNSEAAPLVARRPSSGLQVVHHGDVLNPHRSVSNVFFQHGACRHRQPDPLTPLKTLSRVVALRSASVRSHTPVLSPETIFHRHTTVSLTRNVLGNISRHNIFIELSSTLCNSCLDNYVKRAIKLSVLLLLLLLLFCIWPPVLHYRGPLEIMNEEKHELGVSRLQGYVVYFHLKIAERIGETDGIKALNRNGKALKKEKCISWVVSVSRDSMAQCRNEVCTDLVIIGPNFSEAIGINRFKAANN